MTIVLALVVIAAVAALTGAVRRLALRHELMDVPNERSSHETPTPRGGGIAVVVVFLAAVFYAAFNIAPLESVAIALAGGAAVAAVGFVDDRTDVPPILRLLVHTGAAIWCVAWLGPLASVPFPGADLYFAGFNGFLAVLWLVALTNIYNFMDGIDGIAGAEAVTVSGSAALIAVFHGSPEFAFLPAMLAATSLGFLLWNWPPARIFMGDGGSGFIGFTVGALGLAIHNAGIIDIWSWLILLGVFLVDATFTLLRRLFRGEHVFEAHRKHAYQHASRRWNGHRPVTLGVIVINIVWLLPLAWAAAAYPHWGFVLTAIAWAPLLGLAVWLGAGTDDRRGRKRDELQAH